MTQLHRLPKPGEPPRQLLESERSRMVTEAGALDKNRRHATYRHRCDECWLLIAANGGKPSGLFEPSEETKRHIYRSSFAKTLFMEIFDQELIELNTEAA